LDARRDINRRKFFAATVKKAFTAGILPYGLASSLFGVAQSFAAQAASPSLRKDWLARWERNILGDARNRYCDREMGEEIGWLVSPFLSGFHYGYLATGDVRWIDRLVDWADAWIARGVKEPDGYIGWPKADGASTSVMAGLYTDNILGEAMALRPIINTSGLIVNTPLLKSKHAKKAEGYIRLAEQIFEKWDRRGCWRDVKGGGVWVVPPFGLDRQIGKWSDGYTRRLTDGFSLPANKQNLVALWLLAMHDATKKPLYRERAEKWWQVMKARMRLQQGGKFYVWNYWDPAGPWDYKSDGSPKHWVGVHPNGGYYAVDLEGIVTAYDRGMVFEKEDLKRLVATNRDYMWNQKIQNAKFQRIDGGQPDPRWKDSAGVLWTALVPHDSTLRKVFEANHRPDNWGGLTTTPWYLALSKFD
jgi:hypothetical protein